MLSFPAVLGAALMLATACPVAFADVSLIVPGFDEQPLSATELGVNAEGRTTWAIMPGVATNTDEDVGFFGTAILIEGPSDAHLIDDVPELTMTLDITCTIANGLADCAGNGYDSTPVALGTQGPFLVQGNAAPAATAGSASATGSTGATASPGSSATVTAAPTGSAASSSSTTATATPSGSGASAARTVATFGSFAAALTAAYILV
ncbi:hypothetical protein PENSPDRAFT_752195 [Peniophora sp. CONT]|nr:hypothetical protein PENSPDRAFT_752195 [Peniophora sp. CONT]